MSIKNYARNALSVAYSTDGKTLASTDGYGIAIWDIETRTQKTTLVDKHAAETIAAVSFSTDNRTIAGADWDGIINLWDFTTGEHIQTLKGHTDEIRSIAFSSDGKMLASAGNDHSIRIWDAASGEQIHTLEEEKGRAFSVAFSPDNQTLASGGFNGVVRFWDVATGEQKMRLPNTGNGFSIQYSPNGVLLATTGMMSVKLWHAKTGEEILELDYRSKILQDRIRLGGEKPEKMIEVMMDFQQNFMMNSQESLAFSPDGSLLVVARRNGPINLWDIETQTLKKSYSGHKWMVESVAFAPDGKTFASGSVDGSILIWEVP